MTPADRPPTSPDRAVRVAIVRHERAPGGDHLDLFIGPAEATDPDARVARCWRLPLAAWTAEGLTHGRFAATEIALHRADYLSLDSARELSDNRGRVVPLARGPGHALPTATPITTVTALGCHLVLGPDSVEISSAPPEGHPHAVDAH